MSISERLYPLQWIIFVYKFFGLWHFQPNKYLLQTFGFVLHLVITAPFILSLVLDRALTNLSDLNTFAIGMMFCEVALCIKVFNLLFTNQDLRNIIEKLDSVKMEPQNSKEFDAYMQASEIQKLKVAGRAYYTLSIFCVSLAIFGFVTAYFHGVVMCPYTDWFYGYRCSSGGRFYNFLFFYHCIVMSMHVMINITTDIFIPTLFAGLAGQLAILGERLESISGGFFEQPSEKCHQTLKECVILHNEILSIKDLYQEKFQFAIFVQTMMSSVVICISAYELSKVRYF